MGKDEDYGDRTELAREPPVPRRSSGHSAPIVTPSDTWSDDPWDRTSHAREGAQLARGLELRLSRWQSGAEPPRRAVVQEPEERTGGGARARLPIALVSEDRRRGTLVIGWVDPGAQRIELRPYAWLDGQHQARFGQPWEVSVGAYEALAREVAAVAREHSLGVHVLEAAPEIEARASIAGVAEVPRWVWVALGVLIGVLLAVLAVKL